MRNLLFIHRTATLVIETKDLWRVYPSKTRAEGIPALRGVNLNVEPGTFVAMKGRSGSAAAGYSSPRSKSIILPSSP